MGASPPRPSRCPRAAARSAASARSSPPTRSPAPGSMTVPDRRPAPAAPASARSSSLVLRLRRRQRPVRLRLEPVASRRSPARPTRGCRSYRRRRGVGRLHPLRRRGPGPGARDADGTGGPTTPTHRRRRRYRVHRYRPRIEGLFARIERWTRRRDRRHPLALDLRATTSPRSTARTADSRDRRPAPIPTRVFSWLICESYDDKGNAIVYEYKAEDDDRRRSRRRRTSATAPTRAAPPTAT